MAKYVDADGLKRALFGIKSYIDDIVERNQLITSAAFNEVEQMIENLHDEVVLTED